MSVDCKASRGLARPTERQAAQKWNLSSSPHRRRRSGDETISADDQPLFPNGYAALLLKSPPPAPPAFLRRIGVKELTGVGKPISEDNRLTGICKRDINVHI
ncbi:hypothetical protein PV328_004629 [Microctonus aethiopoides]|uniref:Uncharacterized protein n=1 Tax=Microctonus aethiopoides TaxID=144406 RepID=A0AA39FAX5_9HYME|nr:hypothetical protein PV328_004629 [Microctonus aethiopoides]